MQSLLSVFTTATLALTAGVAAQSASEPIVAEQPSAGSLNPVSVVSHAERAYRLSETRHEVLNVPHDSDAPAVPVRVFRGTTMPVDALEPDAKPGRFVLAIDGANAAGALWTADGSFELRGTGRLLPDGAPELAMTPVAGGLPACLTNAEHADEPMLAPNIDYELEGATASASRQETTARVLIVLTEETTNQLGANALSYAAALVASANDAYQNSDITGFRIELAGVSFQGPAPASNGGSILRYATGKGDGFLDQLHDLKDAYAADLVATIPDIPSFCGVAWLSPTDPDFGTFSVSDYDCALGNLTFAHELGHNLGCAHDPDNANSGFYNDSFGHRWNYNNYRSVMAYAPGSRVPYFSNPDIFAFGGATGIAGQRDNARTIDNTGSSVASFQVGLGDPTDCNSDGLPDAVQIARGELRDDNQNSTPDTCDIASGGFNDCNNNGIIDEYDLRPIVTFIEGPLGPLGETSVVDQTISDVPEADSPVTLTMSGYGDLSSSSETISIFFGGVSINAFQNASADCYSPRDNESFTISAQDFNDARSQGQLRVYLSSTGSTNPTLCNLDTQVTLSFRYQTRYGSVDTNNDGVLDTCPTTCLADTNEDGTLNGADFNAWLTAFARREALGDQNQDGIFNGADFNAWLTNFANGCG